MGIIYPDNENRAKRVSQFTTFIAGIQTETYQSIDRVDLQSNHQLATIDKIIKQLGFKSLEELKEKMMESLTPEERKRYEDQVEELTKFEGITQSMMEASTVVSFISGVTFKLAKPIITVLDTGALAAGLNLFARGFRLMIQGDDAGVAMMGAAFRTFRAFRIGNRLGDTASKVAKIIRTGAKVLSILGIVLDGILLVVSAIVGAEQKKALQEAIYELSARRFMAKQIEDQAFATETYTVQITSFLITYTTLVKNNTPPETIKQIMDDLLSSVVDGLTEDLAKITDAEVWRQVEEMDKASGDAWTNEDPSHEWVKNWIESQPPIVPEPKATEKSDVVAKGESGEANGDLDQLQKDILEQEHELLEKINRAEKMMLMVGKNFGTTDVGVSWAVKAYLAQLSESMAAEQ